MDKILYRLTRPIISLFIRVFYRPIYKGLDNIPKCGGFVLAGNHTNNLDSLLLISATKRTVHFLAKNSLAKGFKKHLFLGMGIIPVNRAIHDKQALNKAIEVLNEQKVVGVFPEGTINRSKNVILPFKIGAVKMAHDASSLLVSFVITGNYKLFKRSIEIEFYPPINISDDLSYENELLMKNISLELKRKEDNY